MIYKYDAFGNELASNANDSNPFRYAGEYFDRETETYYLRARYYDPATGRFISEDTLRGIPTDSLSLNLYTYCYNSPTRYVDPSGHAVVDFAEFSRATIDPPKESLYQGAMTGPVDVHLILDGVGMIPIAGELADGLNSILYMIEGDFGNAAISAISIVALVGDAAKGAKYGVKVVSEFGDEVVYAVKGLDEAVEGIGKSISIGSRNVTELLGRLPELTGSSRDKLLAIATDPGLRNAISELYRPGASIGDGGTAAALVKEFYEGSSRHLKKARDRLAHLNDLARNPRLGLNERDVLDALRDDLKYAISLFD